MKQSSSDFMGTVIICSDFRAQEEEICSYFHLFPVYLLSSNGARWRRQWHPTPVLLPGKSHGWRSLEGSSPWGRWGSDTTERLHFHFSLSCIGEGNSKPLQCSCLENPKDGGDWWAAGIAQNWTRLKWLSSNGARCHDLSFLNVNFKPTLSVSPFSLIKWLFSSSSY